jgi:AcrR family transcriptional regulator
VEYMGAKKKGAAKSDSEKRRPPAQRRTTLLLIEAAKKEFQQHGFGGTDTNKIARRAGFSPRTFYRWFEDKTAIFLAVYAAWVHEEFARIEQLRAQGASESAFIDAVIAHHRAYHIFRRSLRQLTVEDSQVRAARAASRLEQIERIKLRYKPLSLSTAKVAVFLLQYERLCDALADGEFSDLGVAESEVRRQLQRLYEDLRESR